MNHKDETYNSRLDTRGRTFFFDVKLGHGESRRLVVTQSRMHEGVRERESLTIYEEDVLAFLAELAKAAAAMSERY